MLAKGESRWQHQELSVLDEASPECAKSEKIQRQNPRRRQR
jgi:hypothetical protein